MTGQVNIGRNTLLHKYPSLRFGHDSERNVLWIVTALTALMFTSLVAADAIINWEAIWNDGRRSLITILVLLAGVFWTVTAIVFNKRFPHWLGVTTYINAVIGICFNIAYSTDSFSINTALHVLPATGLYLGWFWRPLPARLILLGTVGALIGAAFNNPIIGLQNEIPWELVFIAILLETIAFFFGAFLRWQLQRKAMTDQLTGALNHRGVRRALRIDLTRASRQGENLSVAVIDFDNFKELNDTHGHAYGDSALIESVKEWVAGSRVYDKIGRIGGDEFLVIFPRTTSKQATHVLERLRASSSFAWTWGVAELAQGDTVDALIEKADRDLYKHKKIRKSNARPVSSVSLSSPKEAKTHPFWLWYRSQTDFSIMTAVLSGVVCVSLLVACIVGAVPLHPLGISSFIFLAIVATGINTVMPLRLGSKYPVWGALWSSCAVLIIFAILIFIKNDFYDSVALLLSTSIVALYLGVFLGDLRARLLQIFSVLVIGAILLTKYWDDPFHEIRLIAVASVVYALITQLFLFEVGSYLYSRSRLHAHHDELTTVLNRYGLEEYGASEINRASRGNYPLCVAVIDCINFKVINDTKGHAVGDKALRDTAKQLVESLDIYDVVARTGGDEFVVLLPYMREADSINKLVRAESESPLRWTAGVAEWKLGETLEDVMRRADATLYAIRGASLS